VNKPISYNGSRNTILDSISHIAKSDDIQDLLLTTTKFNRWVGSITNEIDTFISSDKKWDKHPCIKTRRASITSLEVALLAIL